MKILVIGGTGMIGGHAALYLRSKGHDVTIAGRNVPAAGTPLCALPFLKGDYIANDFDRADLAKFDAMVFTAGNDVRHQPDKNDESRWYRANTEGVPRFFETARAAGIRYGINIGSFYPQVVPDLVATDAYVASRKGADDGIRALAGPDFHAISLNAPYVVGWVPGLDPRGFIKFIHYAEGAMDQTPPFAPPGGVNFISTRSISEAVEGAIERGENGKAYLIGDENLSFQDYLGAFFEALGHERPPVVDQPHPLLPAPLFGYGKSVFYEPDPAEVALLGYRRNDVISTIREMAEQFRKR